jgi:hypothetical protein
MPIAPMDGQQVQYTLAAEAAEVLSGGSGNGAEAGGAGGGDNSTGDTGGSAPSRSVKETEYYDVLGTSR